MLVDVEAERAAATSNKQVFINCQRHSLIRFSSFTTSKTVMSSCDLISYTFSACATVLLQQVCFGETQCRLDYYINGWIFKTVIEWSSSIHRQRRKECDVYINNQHGISLVIFNVFLVNKFHEKTKTNNKPIVLTRKLLPMYPQPDIQYLILLCSEATLLFHILQTS